MSWVRRIGVVAGGLVVVALVGAAAVYGMSERKLAARYTVKPETPAQVVVDSAMLARGAHLATSIGKCTDCHASDLGGGMVIDEPPVGHVPATNLTMGRGGVLYYYDDAALERAIRHGVAHDGRSLLVMPSAEYNKLTDDDVAALIAYIRAQPPVDRNFKRATIGPIIRTMWVAGKVDAAAAEVIEHDAPHRMMAPKGNTVEHGEYLAFVGCAGCHGFGYSGGPMPGTPPDWKPPANLTPTGLAHYELSDFVKMMREGKRPDGTVVDSLMPVRATSLMTDEEIESIFKFLRTLPPKPYGNR